MDFMYYIKVHYVNKNVNEYLTFTGTSTLFVLSYCYLCHISGVDFSSINNIFSIQVSKTDFLSNFKKNLKQIIIKI